MKLKIFGIEFNDVDVSGAAGVIIVIAIIAGALSLGPLMLMMSLNYVFHLLNVWTIMSQVIVVRYWQAFYLIVASLVIRALLL